MALTTNVPPIQFTETGFVAPTDQQILDGVMADINAAFGGGLNPSLSTPQGQLASSFAAIISQCYNAFVELSNQVNPDFADGQWQAAVGEIYFLSPNGATATTVPAICTGAVGLPIPQGSLAKDADGNIYSCTDGGDIGAGGTVTLNFACTTLGPIACPSGSLNTIYQAIPGWDSIVNNVDGTIGSNAESRAQFEARREASVAGNAININAAVQAAVLAVANVLDAYVIDNPNGTTETVGGVTLAANSIYVAVTGGEDLDVATAIWTKKSPGCAMNGNTTEVVTGSPAIYSAPLPQWSITFERPTALPILFSVTILNNSQVPADAVTQIQNAIISVFSGQSGNQRARIGSTVFAFAYAPAIIALGSWAQITGIQVGSSNNSSAQITGSIAGTTLTVSATASGAIAIGQSLVDTTGHILPGTIIESGSGTTWTLNQSQTVSSETMFGIAVNRNDVVVNINQEPTINASNIQVTLQ